MNRWSKTSSGLKTVHDILYQRSYKIFSYEQWVRYGISQSPWVFLTVKTLVDLTSVAFHIYCAELQDLGWSLKSLPEVLHFIKSHTAGIVIWFSFTLLLFFGEVEPEKFLLNST